MSMAVPAYQPLEGALDCSCPRSAQELRQREEGARIKFQFQCRRCGRGWGLWARQPANPDLPPWDDTLPFSADVELEGEDARTWWRGYNAYLNSPEWQDKRQRVFARERTVQGTTAPLCQACWKRDGSTVHHASYRHLRCEPLFELLLCCEPCHDALHNRMSTRD